MVRSAVENARETAHRNTECFPFEYDLLADEGLKRKWLTCRKSLAWRITFAALKLSLLICFVIFVIFPLIFKFCYSLQRSVVFLNFVNVPGNPNYKHPESYGLEGSRNFYLETAPNVKVGVWQILPENLIDTFNETDDESWENALADKQHVIIYNHGNAGSRLTEHRIEVYKLLRKYGHVIAWDYRSYGDSSNEEPSEAVLVQEVIFMYEWVANRSTGHIFVWGHSLGTSLSTQAVALLREKEIQPTGLVLEAPFNNLGEEISEFPLARFFRGLPWFSYTVVEPMLANNFKFETDKHICNVDSPIMILHAKDDMVVPFRLGFKLYEKAKRCRVENQGKVVFHSFSSTFKFGHKFICRDPGLPALIEDFIEEATKLRNTGHTQKNKAH